MAEKVEPGELGEATPEVDWAQWADGNEYRLRRRIDFEQDAERARRAFLAWASRRDLGTRTRWINPDQVLIAAVPKRGSLSLDELAERTGEKTRVLLARVNRGDLAAWKFGGQWSVGPREVARVLTGRMPDPREAPEATSCGVEQ